MAERAFKLALDKYVFVIVLNHIFSDTFSASNLSTAKYIDGVTSGSIEIICA